MKYARLILLVFIPIILACSSDENEKDTESVQQYMVSIMDACEGGNRISYCISKEEFDRLFEELKSKPPQGPSASCGGRWTIDFKDKDGIQRS